MLSLFDPETGSFSGDEWGEIDTRFSYCAVASLALLGQLDALDQSLAAEYIGRCRNFDGGFGMVQGAESHAAQGALLPRLRAQGRETEMVARPVWTSLGTLAILNRLDLVDVDTLSWWLCERQTPSGGLNGRPEKLEDVRPACLLPSLKEPQLIQRGEQVCYSWWDLASLEILGRRHWIDGSKLTSFILSAQVRLAPSLLFLALTRC